MGLTISANCLDSSSIKLFSLISICSHIKEVVIIADCPFHSPDGEELLDEDEIELTTGWVTASCPINLCPLEGYKVQPMWSLMDFQPSS